MPALFPGVTVTVTTPEPPTVVVAPPAPTATVVAVVTGPTGPPGTTGYDHTQGSPSAAWVIPHLLSTPHPNVAVVLAGETQAVWPDVSYPDAHTVLVEFPTAATGTAHLS